MDTRLQILLIGDSCQDIYVYGNCDRISPEAPVPVLLQQRTETKPGMAANVKANLEMLGCEVTFITNTELITKTRFIDKRSGQQLLRVDNDIKLQAWSGQTDINLDDYDAIVFSDYNKGFLTYENMQMILNKYQGPVFIDTKKTDLSIFKNCYVKINELESRSISATTEHLIVTLGSMGATYKNTLYATPLVEVSDVCGAGDTFLAALAYKHTLEGHIELALEFANKAASVTVQHLGVYAPSLEEISCQ
jgi:D-glycero-beta-D-manno-heptose-7-phosphate kinase